MTGKNSLELEGAAVVFDREVDLRTNFWCRECGNQFSGPLHVRRKSMASGKNELTFEEAPCNRCGGHDTSAHVVPVEPGDKTYKSRMERIEKMLDDRKIKIIGKEYRGHYISALAKIAHDNEKNSTGKPNNTGMNEVLGLTSTQGMS